MFRPAARWWNEKKQIKVCFKLQLRVSQLTQIGGDALIVSVVPADTGKPSVKSDKAVVREGDCVWENPLYETVKFIRDLKTGKIQERIYYFVVETELSGAGGVFGEASIDFSSYVDAIKASSVSLPLKNSRTNALLHVSIQRVQEMDQREVEETETAKPHLKEQSLKINFIEDMAFNTAVSHDVNCRASCSASDATMSSSESSSGGETPLQVKMKSGVTEEHAGSWEWLRNYAPEASTDDSPWQQQQQQQPEEAPAIVIKKLRSDLVALSRQAEMSEVELQTLRRQIVKESKRGQDLWIEIMCLKEERDTLKDECERFKAKAKTKLLSGSQNAQATIDELREEVDHSKELNANLRIQLQKTQESNSQLILAVQDLEVMLEQKNRETSPTGMEGSSQGGVVCQSDDDEQKALEELVRGHSNPKEADLLEQQIMDLQTEIEFYKRDKDDLEMQMEQLALDYEIMKQENHELSFRLHQSQIQEKLKMQCECTDEMESQMEEMERQSKEYADSLHTIRKLENRAKILEEELEKHRKGLEVDLEAKVEQEHRAIRAEELLKKYQSKNADTADRLQEEFRMLSSQMSSTFQVNEKLATKALAEANELRSQKCHLEKMLEKMSDQYGTQIRLMGNQIEQMQLQIEERSVQLKDCSDEILILKEEIEMLTAKNSILMEDMGREQILVNELEWLRRSLKETELVVELGTDERIELENRVGLMKNEVKQAHDELHEMRCLVKEKELVIGNLRAEEELLQTQKEKLRKQVHGDLKRRDEVSKMKKRMKDGNSRGTTPDMVKGNSKASKEVANLKEKIKMFEGQIKSKDMDLVTLANTFQEKEKELHNRIAELEEKLELLNRQASSCTQREESRNNGENVNDHPTLTTKSNNRLSDETRGIDKSRKEKVLVKERNTSMEKEQKEMLDRYSEMSVKFAEVEGERQRLVMELQNLKNPNK